VTPRVARALQRLRRGYASSADLSKALVHQLLADGLIVMDEGLMHTYPERGPIWRLTEAGVAAEKASREG
jgi:hypothetical protein